MPSFILYWKMNQQEVADTQALYQAKIKDVFVFLVLADYQNRPSLILNKTLLS